MFTQQIKFTTKNEEDHGMRGGILVQPTDNEVDMFCICGCCGGTLGLDEIEYAPFNDWIDVSEEIMGE